jgi:hypothetical protein
MKLAIPHEVTIVAGKTASDQIIAAHCLAFRCLERFFILLKQRSYVHGVMQVTQVQYTPQCKHTANKQPSF